MSQKVSSKSIHKWVTLTTMTVSVSGEEAFMSQNEEWKYTSSRDSV